MARSLDDTGKHLIRILRQGGAAADQVTQILFDGREEITNKILKAISKKVPEQQIITLIHKEIINLGNAAKDVLLKQGFISAELQSISSSAYLEVLGVVDPTIYKVSKSFVKNVFDIPFPEQGITVNNLFTGTMTGMDQELVNITRTAFLEGQTTAQMVKSIRRAAALFNDPALTRKAQALARTAISQVANQVRFQTFDNEPEVKGVLYVATLDHRTSKICKVLDGQYWARRHQARVPPLHVSCRSTLVPILKGENLDDVKDALRRPAVEIKSAKALEDKGLHTSGGRVRKPSRSDSSPLKGVTKKQYVTYEQWLKTQPVVYQKDILGKTAYDKFVDSGDLKTALGFAT